MKLDYVDFTYIQDKTTGKPVFSGIQITFETRHQDESVIRGSFVVQGSRFIAFTKDQEAGKTIQDLCEELIREHLKVDRVDVDSFEVESVKREVEALKEQNLEMALALSQTGGAI